MPYGGNNMMGLVIVSLGILGVIISFLVADRKKYVIAMGLSLLIIAMGLFQSVSSSVKQWQTQRRISNLQEQQKLNLQALQERLRQTQAQGANSGQAQKPPAPAAPAKK